MSTSQETAKQISGADLPCIEDIKKMTNAIRFLAVDMIELAKSGHPGAPLGMADMAEVLWCRHFVHDPGQPNWFNRDRFILSNGHASALLYALLYLTGYDLSSHELKRFRQLHSKTPGHPEVGITPGVDTTTGPLGQGLANAVGMALAEKQLAIEFNRPGHELVDHLTYVMVGDGCLMEGLSHEVCSLAGTLGLSKLIVLYDDNGISIDGPVKGWFSDDTPARFRAYGWHVIDRVDGHDAHAIDAALTAAKIEARKPGGRPTLICCQTIIGQGAPTKAGTEHVHGAPLGAEEIAAMRQSLDWSHDPFVVPDDILALWRRAQSQGKNHHVAWDVRFNAYEIAFPELAAEFTRRMRGKLPASFIPKSVEVFGLMASQLKAVATRKSSQFVLDELFSFVPELLGGSADLTSSNLTQPAGSRSINKGYVGNYLSYGVREFGMAAIMNGIALHGGYIPYGGTFLTFSDYSKNAIRMAALMKLRVLHVFTHDSIGLGEDGPTHQSIEHISSLRCIPNLDVWRPAGGLETAVAWMCSLMRDSGPSALVLSRQDVRQVLNEVHWVAKIERGGYVFSNPEHFPVQLVLIATGSELGCALDAQISLLSEGFAVRVVSMPSTNVFDRQDAAYREEVLPAGLPKIAIEAAHSDFWYKYVGSEGCVIGINTFGESAPASQLFTHFKITADHIVERAKLLLETPAP